MNDHLMGLSLTCVGWPNYKMSSQQQLSYKKVSKIVHYNERDVFFNVVSWFNRCGYKYEAKATLPQDCRSRWRKKLEQPYLRGVRL